MPERIVDAQGLKCPMPVLRLRKALDRAEPGETLTLLATDQGSRTDVPAFCRIAGVELASTTESDGVFRYTIKKTA